MSNATLNARIKRNNKYRIIAKSSPSHSIGLTNSLILDDDTGLSTYKTTNTATKAALKEVYLIIDIGTNEVKEIYTDKEYNKLLKARKQ